MIFICNYCKKEFVPKDKRHTKYCCRYCYVKNSSKENTRGRKKFYCATCGKEALEQRKYCTTCRKRMIKEAQHPRGKSTYEYLKEARKKQKIYAVNYLGGKCVLCGYDKSMRALQFHHKDAKGKDFTISKSSPYIKEDVLNAELDKCILLCSNCHAELHENLDIENYKQ